MMAKTIVISNETHKLLKEYCNDNSIKLNAWVDSIIKKEMEKLNDIKE